MRHRKRLQRQIAEREGLTVAEQAQQRGIEVGVANRPPTASAHDQGPPMPHRKGQCAADVV
ncbi:hypothetical protein, partial [Klebsiella pneumoniae]|uniref:hypothetical protein n=1 Tax=Klebsiella pneumoniae TaxID=573 RepID=UPI002730BCF4